MKFQQHLETLQFQRTQFKSRNTPRGIACEIGEAGSEGGAGSGQQHTNRPIGAHRGACGAWPGSETTRRTRHQRHKPHWCGGRRRVRRARAGLEIDHSEPLGSRVAISRAAGPDGAQNTRGATSNNARRGRLAGGPPPTGTPSSPAQQSTRGARNTSGTTSNAGNQAGVATPEIRRA